MKRYIIYCTEAQTKKALELGAPIEEFDISSLEGQKSYNYPTAEQMIGWLEEQGFYFRLNTNSCSVEIDYTCIIELVNISRQEATIAAIDAALEYLTNNKK